MTKILTEEELQSTERLIEKMWTTGGISKHEEIELQKLITSHRSLNSRNLKLVLENDELMAENVKLKEFMDWAKRIIDSGMGAGILKYDPVQFFIEYHTYLKSLEVTK